MYSVPMTPGLGGVSAADMEKIYTQRMVPSSSPGRVAYDKIMGSAEHGRCPLCGQRTVTTLDHYLPKAHYSALVVTPANLIPCCSECNKTKGGSAPTCAEDQFPHPYFDEFDDGCWLIASLVETSPPALAFGCMPPLEWDSIKSKRISRHFFELGLAKLYAAHSGSELVNLRGSLRRIHSRLGQPGVRQHLLDVAEGYAEATVNSWQAAMCSALGASDWYCDHGFDF